MASGERRLSAGTAVAPVIVAGLLFAAYAIWIAGPYLRSIVVRDAAVTGWSHVVTAPIAGKITFGSLRIGDAVGSDGVIATIRNDHISRATLDMATLRAELAAASRQQAEKLLEEIEQLEQDRRDTKAEYAELFRDQLDTRIGHFETMIALQEERLAVTRSIAERKEQLASSGTGSINEADEVLLRVTEAQLALDDLRGLLAHAKRRREAAGRGIFIEESGEDPSWALADRMSLKLAKKRAREDLRAAEIEEEAAADALDRSARDIERQARASVTAPPGAVLWQRRVVSGVTVSEGAPVAEWIDCAELLVDMPLSDAEVSLAAEGDAATVVLEGEKTERSATVLLVRGSASPLDRNELAAVAKGRGSDRAQIILSLERKETDAVTCPVGRAAHVDLDGVGLIDVIRARLQF